MRNMKFQVGDLLMYDRAKLGEEQYNYIDYIILLALENYQWRFLRITNHNSWESSDSELSLIRHGWYKVS